MNGTLQFSQQGGTYKHLVKELAIDQDLLKKYMRLTGEQFAQVLYLVEGTLSNIMSVER